jgi:2-oxoglutarate dehydrogenase E1 component
MTSPPPARGRTAGPGGASAEYIDQLYEAFRENPDNVTSEWRSYFYGFEHGAGVGVPAPASAAAQPDAHAAAERLVMAYRLLGHLVADIDPLAEAPPPRPRELEPDYYGLTPGDLAEPYPVVSIDPGRARPLGEVTAILDRVYCGSIGSEHMHIADSAERRWIEQRLESSHGDWSAQHPPEVRRELLRDLTAAEGLEHYLHRRFVGQKRFSLEGAESLIPLLDELVQGAGQRGVTDVVLGMAHRGRLNVLVNLLGKAPQELFLEFEGGGEADMDPSTGSGDVKYHQGFYSNIQTPGGPVRLSLAFNPSHLEIVGPVVEGGVRARQDRHGDAGRARVVPVLIHGDAAISGQGVVMETLNLSQTRGFGTGGTVHIVINNQIGFTTSEPLDSRSTLYCTDVAKMVQAPILHVNGDDPEAVDLVIRTALAFRMEFRRDVVVDLVCYRRHGHSEADEPAATQPLMYQTIRHHPRVVDQYSQRLIEQEILSQADFEAMRQDYLARLEAGEVVARPILTDYRTSYAVDWARHLDGAWDEEVPTRVARTDLSRLLNELTVTPPDFELHPAVAKVMEARRRMATGDRPLDWGAAETLAYATLLENGYPVRLTGQDSGRGTFFHSHAVLHNQADGGRHIPLRQLQEEDPRFLVVDSILSEEAVLGFELGYSAADPETLVIWEAQFGDFANNAQVVIDQFISSSAAKWQRLSGITLLLPHGYDGQGPEHSSARLERFLQLCAEENMQVCYPSTPAQMFHMLRRQVLRAYRRPLVVMSPKSLLRHKLSNSTLEDLSEGAFRPVIHELDDIDPQGVEALLLCSGKVYFDLLEARRKEGRTDTAIVRVEQLYPFPEDAIVEVLDRYPGASSVRWVQEEPWNQGAWFYMHPNLKVFVLPHQTLDCATRPPSASPAAGYLYKHIEQQKQLVRDAFDFTTVRSKGAEGASRLGRERSAN